MKHKTQFIFILIILTIGCENNNIPIKEEQNSQIDFSKSNTFVYNGNYLDWFNIHNDLYFPIELYDTAKHVLLKGNYFLKKKKDWLLLVEVHDSSSVVNEFPIVPLSEKIKIEGIKGHEIDIFPSPHILNKEIQITFEKSNNGSKNYNTSIKIRKKKQHIVISKNDTFPNPDLDVICQYNLSISLLTGNIIFYSKDCTNNYIW